MRLARVLGAVGRVLITAGVLILLFVAYQLWGTGIRQGLAQDELREDFQELLAEAGDGPATTTTSSSTTTTDRSTTPTSSTTSTSTTTTTTTAPPAEVLPPIADGDPVGQLRIPAIGVDETVVENVSLQVLKKGPGHFPETPMPGQEGNAAIAGHRTTYGAPFHRLDELAPGDEVLVQTLQGDFRYEVSEQLIVAPTDVHVLEDKGDDRLTLIACHPKYSARQRIVVVAVLDEEQEALPRPIRRPREGDAVAPVSPTTLDDIDGEEAAIWPTIAYGVLGAAIWLLAWLAGRRWRRLPAYLVGLPLFLVALFFFFEEFSRLLPASY